MHELSKYFLHYIMNNGVIKQSEGDDIIKTIASKINERPKSLKSVLSEINEVLSKQLLKIDTGICEISGEHMCFLINKHVDDISISISNHTAAETELFEKIVFNIMTSDAKYISSIICLNLTSRMKAHITKDDVQDKVDFWNSQGYLAKHEGNVYLGARTISEFEMFLREKFSARMTTCKFCTGFVYHGKICAECNEVLHDHCSKKYFAQISKCPSCKKPWQEAEGRNYDDESDEEGRPGTSQTRERRTRNTNNQTQEENTSGSDESMEY